MAKKILFIEDERRFQETLGAKLQKEGYEMLAAFDGESGLKMVEEEKPDLILLDLILPKKDGFKVLEILKAKPELSPIPVIVVTNLESKKDIEKALSLGVRSYLVKASYTLDEIAQKVREIFK